MREIKFRGKNKDLGFVEGQLAFDENENAYIIQNVEMDSSYGLEETMLFASMWYRVDKNTLGQYTGLHDKNGKEIYEGDIVKHDSFYEGDCYCSAGYGQVLWDEEETGFYLTAKDTSFIDLFNLTKNLNGEVIGNIYDNPELLKEE